MQPVDLHTHTTFSDGSFTPDELIAYAHQKKLQAIAITDHDTIDGLASGAAAAEKYGIELVRGVEIAAYYQENIEIHILGLLIDPNNPELIHSLAGLKKAREIRNMQIIEEFKRIGIDIDVGKIKAKIQYNQLSRAHFAMYLLENGNVSTSEEAYQKYLSPGTPTYVRRPLLSYAKCIDLIKGSGGIAVLAHPFLYGLDFRGIETLVAELQSKGLQGIEALHPSHTAYDETRLKQLAGRLGLCITGGSDFHGKIKQGIDLGTGRGRLHVPYKIVMNLYTVKRG